MSQFQGFKNKLWVYAYVRGSRWVRARVVKKLMRGMWMVRWNNGQHLEISTLTRENLRYEHEHAERSLAA